MKYLVRWMEYAAVNPTVIIMAIRAKNITLYTAHYIYSNTSTRRFRRRQRYLLTLDFAILMLLAGHQTLRHVMFRRAFANNSH